MVSVIIRNKNEASYIGFAIQSIIDYIPNSEIVIVDDNSNDDSIEIVNLFKRSIEIKIIGIKGYSPGKAIMVGASHSYNDTLLVMSAHSQITNLDLGSIAPDLQTYAAIFGKQVPIYKGKKITPRYIWSHFVNEKVVNMHSNIENRYFLHNAFCFYNKKFLLENPFDESIPGKEDRYWAKKIVSLGYSYLYDPTHQVNHYYTNNGATWKGIG